MPIRKLGLLAAFDPENAESVLDLARALNTYLNTNGDLSQPHLARLTNHQRTTIAIIVQWYHHRSVVRDAVENFLNRTLRTTGAIARDYVREVGILEATTTEQEIRPAKPGEAITCSINMIDLIPPPEENEGRSKEKNQIPVIPREGLQREAAQVGVRDLSKLEMEFQTVRSTRRRNPDGSTSCVPLRNDKGRYVQGSGASFVYNSTKLPRLDWNNRDHIKSINAWREQLLRRHFGQKRETRDFWTEAERGWVLGLAERQLRTRSNIDFNKLANDYNSTYYRRPQPAGMRMIRDGRKEGGNWTSEVRSTPWRSVSAILGQSKKWPEWQAMETEGCKLRRGMTAAELAYNNGNTVDFEIPNPDAVGDEDGGADGNDGKDDGDAEKSGEDDADGGN